MVGLGVPAAPGSGALVRRRVRAAPAPAVGRGMEDHHRGAGHNRSGRGRRHRRATPSESFRLTAGRGVGIGVGGYAPVRQGCPADRQRDQHAGHRSAAQRVQVDLQPASANETAGFSLAAPTNWAESTSGYQTYLKDPAEPNTNILVDLTPHAYPNDMLREARFIEARSIPGFPGYHRLGLAAINIRGTSGSFWKFTWVKAGVQQEALDLLFVLHTSAGPQSYALYMTAPESIFAQIRPVFDEEVETFAAVPS